MKILCLHHNDADGFGAAWALHTALGAENEVTYTPVQYGQEPPSVDGFDFVYILDFSYKREVMHGLVEKTYGKLICIDHHKTAQAELEGFGCCIFDMTKSGAVLTWEYFYPLDTEPPAILQYVQDRDLWKFELPMSEAVNAYISILPQSFESWDDFDLSIASTSGLAVLAAYGRQMESRLKDVKMVKVQFPNPYDFDQDVSFTVPCLNASENISELGNEMCRLYPDAPFSMSYCDRQDGKRSYSLRSIGNFDVSAVAKAFGGGGHKNAAGFSLPAPEVI